MDTQGPQDAAARAQEIRETVADAVTALMTDSNNSANGVGDVDVIEQILDDMLSDREVTEGVIGSLVGLATPTVQRLCHHAFDGDWAAMMADMRRSMTAP